MVWHDAIGMQREASLSGDFQEMVDQPLARRFIREERGAPFRSYGDETSDAAAIVFRWEA